MPRIITLLRHAFGSETVLHECRHCGTTLEADDDCPACGATDIATYRFNK